MSARIADPMSEPTSLSIVLCACNGERFLREQLASIAAQTRLPDRLVFVDDRSNDETVRIAGRFAETAPFPVEITVNEENLGFVANFGRAIGMARNADVIVLSDQDDVWHPQRLSRTEAAFQAHPDAGMVFSDADLVDEGLRPLDRSLWQVNGFTPARRADAAAGRLFETLLRGNVVTGATLAIRGEHLPLVLPVRGRIGHDAWIALILSAISPAVALPDRLVRYRQHGANQIGARRLSVRQRMRRASARRLDDLAAWHEHHLEALARLEGVQAPGIEARLEMLRDSVDHLAARARLPARRTGRAGTVARELIEGRYSRLSGGLGSAVRDLLA